MEATSTTHGAVSEPGGGIVGILKSYFYWNYPRGSMHYDVMVTLILLFIFITPHLWDYGAKPLHPGGPPHPIQVIGDGHGLVLTVQAVDVQIPAGASNFQVRETLRSAIEPVTGDAVFVDRWETVKDQQGNLEWKVWVHR